MKIDIKRVSIGVYKVILVQDHQSFEFAYRGHKKECEWYKEMFEIALKRHEESIKPLI